MKQKISIKKAIAIGQLVVNGSLITVFILVMGLFMYVLKFPVYLGVLISIILSWLTWSIVITKWRIWAFTNVENVHKLEREAVRTNLIWPRGSSFEKTEIRTKHDKLLIKKIEEQLDGREVKEKDTSLPLTTKIYYSVAEIYISLIICLALTLGLPYLILKADVVEADGTVKWLLVVLIVGVGLYFCNVMFKKLKYKEPELEINSKGLFIKDKGFICWETIYDTAIERGNSKKESVYLCCYNAAYVEIAKVDIAVLQVKEEALELMLTTYKSRYKQEIARKP